jgi:hypothetical protein
MKVLIKQLEKYNNKSRFKTLKLNPTKRKRLFQIIIDIIEFGDNNS